MNPDEKRKLGRTDVELTQFGFGAASLGDIFALVSEEDTLSTLQTLWKHGVRYIDTAPLYGWGLSEHRVGSFLYQQPRQEFVLSTNLAGRRQWDVFSKPLKLKQVLRRLSL